MREQTDCRVLGHDVVNVVLIYYIFQSRLLIIMKTVYSKFSHCFGRFYGFDVAIIEPTFLVFCIDCGIVSLTILLGVCVIITIVVNVR